MSDREFSQRIGAASGVLLAGRTVDPGSNVLTNTEGAWRNPNRELHSQAITSLTINGRLITGEQLTTKLNNPGITPVTRLLATAVHNQVDPSVVWVATHARAGVQRYALLAGDPSAPDLWVAGGNRDDASDKDTDVSPFFRPSDTRRLLQAGMSVEDILANRASMLEVAVSAAYLREMSKSAQCVGDRPLVTEAGHTFAALLSGSVFARRTSVDGHVNMVMGRTSGLDPHVPHNVDKAHASLLRYDRYAVAGVSGYRSPDLLTVDAPLIGSAERIPSDQIESKGWALGIDTSTISLTSEGPKLAIARVVGLAHAAPGMAAIYATEHPDQARLASYTS